MRTSTWLKIIGVAVLVLVIGLVSGFIPIKTEPKKPIQTEQKIAELTEELAETKQQLNELSENYVLNTIEDISGAVTDLSEFDLYLDDDGEYKLHYNLDYNRIIASDGELDFTDYEYTGDLDLSDIIIPSNVAEIEVNVNDHFRYIMDDYTRSRIRSGLSIQVPCYDLFGPDYENEIVLYLSSINGSVYYYSNLEKLNTEPIYNEASSPIYYEIEINSNNFQIYNTLTTVYSKLYSHHFDVSIGSDAAYWMPSDYRIDLNFNIISNQSEEFETLSEIDGAGYIASAFGAFHYIPNNQINYNNIVEANLFYSSLYNGTLLVTLYDITDNSVRSHIISNLNDYALLDSVSAIN